MEKAEVLFKYRAHAKFGQEIYITGNIEALGNWNIQKAAKMVTSVTEYPNWELPSPVVIPLEEEIEYKYFSQQMNSIIWEKVGGNRKLYIKESHVVVEDTQNDPVSKVKYIYRHKPNEPVSDAQTELHYDFTLEFDSTDTLILASFSLPIVAAKNPSYTPGDPDSKKWVFAASSEIWQKHLHSMLMSRGVDFKWVGIPNIYGLTESEKQELERIYRADYSCEPIFLDEEVYTAFVKYIYVLEERLNCIIPIYPGYSSSNFNEYWQIYKQVNTRFAEKILSIHSNELI